MLGSPQKNNWKPKTCNRAQFRTTLLARRYVHYWKRRRRTSDFDGEYLRNG